MSSPPPPQQNFARTPMHRGYTAEKDMMHSPCVLNQPRPMSTGTQSIRCMVTFGKCYSVSPYQFIIRYFHFHLKQGLKSYQLHQFFGQRPIAMSLGISLEFNLSLGKHFSHSYYHSYTLRNRTLWVWMLILLKSAFLCTCFRRLVREYTFETNSCKRSSSKVSTTWPPPNKDAAVLLLKWHRYTWFNSIFIPFSPHKWKK